METVYDSMGKPSKNLTEQDQQTIVKDFRQDGFENRIKAQDVSRPSISTKKTIIL